MRATTMAEQEESKMSEDGHEAVQYKDEVRDDAEQAEREPSIDPEELVGLVLGGRYEVKSPLGRGGMGFVYLAHQHHLSRDVVVKVLGKGLSDQGEALKRFEREALGLSRLTHPNIVTIHDFGQDHDQAYIVMEYVDGQMLSQLMSDVGRMQFDLFALIASQILAALSEAHRLGIIHRDIKPSNIMLTERHGTPNFVKVLDFGLVKLIGDAVEVTKKQNLVGSVSFLAPEQILGLEFDQRADVYALGVLFYYMLAGKKPFGGEDDIAILYQHIHNEVPSLAGALPEGHDIPEQLIALIERCLSKEPADRPTDAQHVLEEMGALGVGDEAMRLPWVSGEFAAVSRERVMASSSSSGPVTALSIEDSSARLPTLTLDSSGSYRQLAVESSSPWSEASEASETSREVIAHSEQFPSSPSHTTLVVERAPHTKGLLIGVALLLFVLIAGGGALMIASHTNPHTTSGANVGAPPQSEEELFGDVDALLKESKWGQAESVLDVLKTKASGAPSKERRAISLDIAEREEQLAIGRLMQKATLAEEREDFDRAQNFFEEVLARDPTHPAARERLDAYTKRAGEDTVAFGTLAVTSRPQGATVYVGEMELGRTPLEAELEPGDYTVRIELRGYEPREDRVELVASGRVSAGGALTKRARRTQRDASLQPKAHDPAKQSGKVPKKTPQDTAPSTRDDLLIPVEKSPKKRDPLLEDGLLPVGQ